MARFARVRIVFAVVFALPAAIGSFPAVVAAPAADSGAAQASQRVLELRFTPTARAQMALWIEKPDGTFVTTLFLTQAVGHRGIGNRPGASQMNSGFHWPYGRREGVLPIWAHRRAAAPGAQQWKRVIFQNRVSEGDASQTTSDQSRDDYFCLSFTNAFSEKDALDAVSCATTFSSDKGRYMTADDVTKGYAEPTDNGTTRSLDLVSLYPPRTDVMRCTSSPTGCFDTPDVSTYADHARAVMPEIDSVTMATPPGGDVEQSFLFAVPADWPDGPYVVWAEVNTEGDDNDSYRFGTPSGPGWDSWAVSYGYPYRGQPSVAYEVPISIGTAGTASTAQPAGYGDVAGYGPAGGALHAMDSTITNDPAAVPGSGADRLRLISGRDYRLHVESRGGGGQDPCPMASAPPGVPQSVQVTPVADPKHSHEWGHLHFVVPASGLAIHDYEVRVSEAEITTTEPSTFEHAARANVAAVEDGMLIVPTTGAAGSTVDVNFGHLKPTTSYYVAVRANDVCARPGPYAVGTMSTTNINFTKLSGCFVATAAFGSALEPRVQALRAVRDELRPRSAAFSTAVDLYYQSGPPAAALIARSDSARALVRRLLGPVVALAQAGNLAK